MHHIKTMKTGKIFYNSFHIVFLIINLLPFPSSDSTSRVLSIVSRFCYTTLFWTWKAC